MQHFSACKRCSNYRSLYGITSLEFNWMYFLQGGVCAIEGCMNEATCVDHCHETNKIRKLLCHTCNVSLGALDEDITKMIGLIRYKLDHL